MTLTLPIAGKRQSVEQGVKNPVNPENIAGVPVTQG